MTQEELIKYGKDNYQQALDLLMTLGKIPAPSHKEDKRAQFVYQWFKDNGGKDVHIDNAKNVILSLNDNGCNDLYVVMAHMDVVFEDLTELPMTLKDNILAAPGIGDDTNNLVNLMIASKYMMANEDKLNCGLLIVANSCEEGLGNLDGSKEIEKEYGSRIKSWISFDGNIGSVVNIPVGSHRYSISVNTQGGHSYGNFGRDNAIEILANIIVDLYKVQVPSETKTTYNVGVISGGSTVNSIAQSASVLYEYRSSSQNCLAIMKDNMNNIINKYINDGKHVKVELLGERPGIGEMDMAALDKYTKNNISIINKVIDQPLNITSGSTDANIPLSKGILANTIGSANGTGAHTREEYVDINYIPVGISMVLSILDSYLK